MYHVRQLDDTGFTIRQLTVNFPTIKAARAAAVKAERQTGDEHTVCESLEPTDPRNPKGEDRAGRFGFAALPDDATDENPSGTKAKAKAK